MHRLSYMHLWHTITCGAYEGSYTLDYRNDWLPTFYTGGFSTNTVSSFPCVIISTCVCMYILFVNISIDIFSIDIRVQWLYAYINTRQHRDLYDDTPINSGVNVYFYIDKLPIFVVKLSFWVSIGKVFYRSNNGAAPVAGMRDPPNQLPVMREVYMYYQWTFLYYSNNETSSISIASECIDCNSWSDLVHCNCPDSNIDMGCEVLEDDRSIIGTLHVIYRQCVTSQTACCWIVGKHMNII